MPLVLTGKQMDALTYEDGGAVDGTFTDSTPVDLKCYCVQYERAASVESLDITARCDSTRKRIPTIGDVRITLQLRVPSAGPLIPHANVGKYAEISMTRVAAGTPVTDILMIEESTESSPENDVVIQTVVLGPVI